MNSTSTLSAADLHWKIHSVEVNSEVASATEFESVVINSSEVRIEPAGIALSVRRSSNQEILFNRGSELYVGHISQNGSRLALALQCPAKLESVLIKATRQVSSLKCHDDFIVTPESASIT